MKEMAEESLAIAVVLTALVLVAFAWMVKSTRKMQKKGEQRAREISERTLKLERHASLLDQGVRELKTGAEKKADQGYVEKRINGLIGLVKTRTD